MCWPSKSKIYLIQGILCLVFALPVPGLLGQVHRVDAVLSSIKFTAINLGFLEVEGTFHVFSANAIVTHGVIDTAYLQIDVRSIDTDDKMRDSSLMDEDIFDPDQHPFIEFRGLQKGNTLVGELTIKGITHQIRISDFTVKEIKEGLVLNFIHSILRSQYEIDLGLMDDLVKDEVLIRTELFLVKNK